MIARQGSSLLTEMELVKSIMKLTPEERKKEARRQMYVELKAMEMQRRQRVALETMEKCEREREEREKATESLRRQKEKNQEERMRREAKQREEEERRANEEKALERTKQDQLKKERLQWRKVMMVEEEPVKRPKCTLSALRKEQQKRREEAGDKAGPERLISDQKSKKKTLHNNWVGEQKTDSEPVKEKFHPNSSTYLLFAAKPGPKSEEKTKTPKPNETLRWLPETLKVGYWVDKYRDHRERKGEKRKLKAEEQYARWTTFKAGRASQFSRQNDFYTEGFATDRNSILKSIF